MQGQKEPFHSPVTKSQKGTDTDTAKSGCTASFRCTQPPAVVTLTAGRMNLTVTFFIVGFLVDDQAIYSLSDKCLVIVGQHGIEFDGYGGKPGPQFFQRLRQVLHGDNPRCFSGHEQYMAKPLNVQIGGFGFGLLCRKRQAFDRVLYVKSAINTGICAFIGKVERGKQADHPAESLLGEPVRSLGQLFQKSLRGRGQEADESIHVQKPGR